MYFQVALYARDCSCRVENTAMNYFRTQLTLCTQMGVRGCMGVIIKGSSVEEGRGGPGRAALTSIFFGGVFFL